jgi:hypothetical protein
VTPQQMPPQRSGFTTGDAHMFPPVHDGFVPHMHVPSMHASPSAQHVLPHWAPAHVPDGAQLRPSRCTAASGTLELEPEQPNSERTIRSRII